ncbi:sterol desaturase family protein [Marivirga arenosa]|uniref:Sterol desaturase family protein n=1 Tax=Marivirga arenosa TaxID=3059076 RepID=A0AA49GDI1_9BACT|nr:sterol desaturase family protein [Marivirga sp. BKB1-2]WKK79833.2 sterol desaturase family protein [Marivirga sp. BKB1-2]
MNVYTYITPIVVLLFLIEIIITLRFQKKNYPFQDTITNLGTGIGNQCINLAVAFFVYKWYGFLFELTPFRIEVTWYTMVLLLLLQDFIFYWFHRLGHSINIFWAAHMAHHSSEEMNLSVGIRASFTQRLFQFLFFDWVLVVIGFSPEIVYAMAAVHLLLAYWHHTSLIKKMGWFEKFFVTPSHHRVHHGVNPQYIDKNFSEFLIIWDKLFGSFEPEEEEVCYGVTHPPRTWHPINLNFQFWKQLWDDAKNTKSFKDKLRIWFMPTGWRPADLVDEPLPSVIGYNKSEQVKYKSSSLENSKNYLIVQLIIGLAFMSFTINMNLPLSFWERFILSSGLFMMIISWSGILESKRWALGMEVVRILFMAFSLIFVLHQAEIMSFTSWSTFFILIVSGLSISYAGYHFNHKNQKLHQEAI